MIFVNNSNDDTPHLAWLLRLTYSTVRHVEFVYENPWISKVLFIWTRLGTDCNILGKWNGRKGLRQGEESTRAMILHSKVENQSNFILLIAEQETAERAGKSTVEKIWGWESGPEGWSLKCIVSDCGLLASLHGPLLIIVFLGIVSPYHSYRFFYYSLNFIALRTFPSLLITISKFCHIVPALG